MRRKHSADVIFAVLLYGMFALISLLLVVMGSQVYRSIVRRIDARSEARASLSYVANRIRSADRAELSRQGDLTVLVLQAVVSQQLIPTVDGGLIPAFEIMTATPAIRTMIRDSKVYQMDNVLYAGAEQGMQTMDADVLRLYREGVISREHALAYSANPDMMAKKL